MIAIIFKQYSVYDTYDNPKNHNHWLGNDDNVIPSPLRSYILVSRSLQANYSQKPLRSSNPGYALYSTDSDADQVGG